MQRLRTAEEMSRFASVVRSPGEDIDRFIQGLTYEFNSWGPEVRIDQNRIDKFAEVSGDDQAIHVDREAARVGAFGCTIAQGFLTLSLLAETERQQMNLLRETCPQMSLIHKGGSYEFMTPVLVGSRIHSRGRIVEPPQRRGNILVKFRYEYHIDIIDSGKPAAKGWMDLVFVAAKK